MLYTIIVCGNPYGSQSSLSAYHFSRAVIAKGHQIRSVFFYSGGVLNGSTISSGKSEELHLPTAWQDLHYLNGTELQICSGSAGHTGLIDNHQPRRSGVGQNCIAEGFTITGLGSLTESMIKSDRVITFGTTS